MHLILHGYSMRIGFCHLACVISHNILSELVVYIGSIIVLIVIIMSTYYLIYIQVYNILYIQSCSYSDCEF